MTSGIKPIPTRYAGCHFRSRLEARWAVFMDHLGVPWRYEPEGYVVDGAPYLPDFLVYPDSGQAFWLEIKGTFPSAEELAKAKGLAEGTGIRAFVYWGEVSVPAPDLSQLDFRAYAGLDENVEYRWDDHCGWLIRDLPSPAPRWEWDLAPTAFFFYPGAGDRAPRSACWWWTDCHYCGRVIPKIHGQIGVCPNESDDSIVSRDLYPNFAHHTPRLMSAYQAARSARFEHGETPSRPLPIPTRA